MLRWLLLAVELIVALPELVLAATPGRLSAELRDRRLANLRLLGLSPARTRLVAVTETGAVAAVGAVLGLGVFLLVRPLLHGLRLTGRDSAPTDTAPLLLDYVVVLVGVTAAVVALASLPQRLDMTSVLRRARRAEARRPAGWRWLPLLAGLALCTYVVLSPGGPDDRTVVVAFLGGVSLTGIGLLLVTPVLVHVLAGALVRHGSPVTTVAGRRLQAQPAGVTRVVAALLIGLFLVNGARAVVVAFESTPQYVAADRDLHEGQRVLLDGTQREAPALARGAMQQRGVRAAVTLPHVVGCADRSSGCVDAVVATCAQLRQAAPDLTGCVDGVPMWITVDPGVRGRDDLPWYASTGDTDLTHPVASFPAPTRRLPADAFELLSPLQAMAVVPPALVPDLPARTATDVLVLGPPGRTLADRLAYGGGYMMAGDFAYHDFVSGLRALVWGVAAVILSVGLLSFGIAAVDRAVTRRREVVGLQLVGVPPGLLRRAQWLEAALPITVGTLLAIGLGLVCGATYLSLDDGRLRLPWTQSLTLATAAVVAAAVLAGLTVLAASPRLRPDLIRTA
ncbi:MAG: hypothetical protein HOQ22_02830 [Nocardioidaceae bacterium]|nr:hypothetical protein [Nocardioidaceae bacterium]